MKFAIMFQLQTPRPLDADQGCAEIGGFLTSHEEKKQAWEEATRECLRMMTSVP